MSFCPSCGKQNPDGVAFCAYCGQSMTLQPVPPTGYPGPNYTAPIGYTPPSTTLPAAARVTSIIAMICGILSCCTFYVGFLFSIPALILAAQSKGKTPAGVSNGKATAGIITGAIGIGLSLLWFIVLLAGL